MRNRQRQKCIVGDIAMCYTVCGKIWSSNYFWYSKLFWQFYFLAYSCRAAQCHAYTLKLKNLENYQVLFPLLKSTPENGNKCLSCSTMYYELGARSRTSKFFPEINFSTVFGISSILFIRQLVSSLKMQYTGNCTVTTYMLQGDGLSIYSTPCDHENFTNNNFMPQVYLRCYGKSRWNWAEIKISFLAYIESLWNSLSNTVCFVYMGHMVCMIYTPIAFNERVTFWLQRARVTALCVHVCCIVCVCDCIMVIRKPMRK